MSVIHLHPDELKDFGSVATRAFGWLKTMHQAIVTAKLERLENELVLRRGYSENLASDRDAVRYPQRPLVLSDKWDF
jgi:hypothetical protein